METSGAVNQPATTAASASGIQSSLAAFFDDISAQFRAHSRAQEDAIAAQQLEIRRLRSRLAAAEDDLARSRTAAAAAATASESHPAPVPAPVSVPRPEPVSAPTPSPQPPQPPPQPPQPPRPHPMDLLASASESASSRDSEDTRIRNRAAELARVPRSGTNHIADEIKEYRRQHNLCHYCGSPDHVQADCEDRRRRNARRAASRQQQQQQQQQQRNAAVPVAAAAAASSSSSPPEPSSKNESRKRPRLSVSANLPS